MPGPPCQHHDIDDLSTPEHRLNKGGVTRAIHERELELIVGEMREILRQWGHEAREAEVEGDAAFRALWVLVKRRRRKVRGERSG